MYSNQIGVAIKDFLSTEATLSYFDKVRLVDEPVPTDLKEIQIQFDDYEGQYLDSFSYQYVIHSFRYNIIINSIRPQIETHASDDDTILMQMADDVHAALQTETLGGILFGDGIKVIDWNRSTNKQKRNLVHSVTLNIECEYVDPDDFTDAIIGRGYLYYGTSPGSALTHSQISWTMFGSKKIPMVWSERYVLWGADVGDTSFDDTEPPLAPKDLQIQRNHPMAMGYSLEASNQDVFSKVMSRPKSGTDRVWRNREGADISPFTNDVVLAWKFEVTLPSGDKWIEFVPSGVMVPGEKHERIHDSTSITRLDFEIYFRENTAYYEKKQKMGYSLLEAA